MAGGVCTVKVAAFVVALPTTFVKTASYSFPLIAWGILVSVSAVDVAPLLLVKLLPPLVLTCHCTVGVGFPLAAAGKVTELPAVTVWLFGCVVMAGAKSTVRIAAFVVAL